MFILGGLQLLCGFCAVAVVILSPVGTLLAGSQVQIPDASGLGLSPEQLVRAIFAVMAAMCFAGGIAMIVLGMFVRRASRVATILSLILTSLILLLLAINLISMISQPVSSATGEVHLVSVGIVLATAALFAVELGLLISALRAIPAVNAARQQLAMQYLQYQQYQRMYWQGGAVSSGQASAQSNPASSPSSPDTGSARQ